MRLLSVILILFGASFSVSQEDLSDCAEKSKKWDQLRLGNYQNFDAWKMLRQHEERMRCYEKPSSDPQNLRPAKNIGDTPLDKEGSFWMPEQKIVTSLNLGARTLGSATRVCTVDRSASWYVTAAHVVEGEAFKQLNMGKERARFQVGPKQEPAELVSLLPSMEFALLKAPLTTEPCAEVASTFWLDQTFDVSNYLNPVFAFAIEAWDPLSNKIIRRGFDWTHSALSLTSALPHRLDTGPLLLLPIQRRKGNSGGAIISEFTNEGSTGFSNGLIAKRFITHLPQRGSFHAYPPLTPKESVVIGIILATDLEGFLTAALPAPTVHVLLSLYFQGDPRVQRIDRSWQRTEAGLHKYGAIFSHGGLSVRERNRLTAAGYFNEVRGGGLSDGGSGANAAEVRGGGLSDGGSTIDSTIEQSNRGIVYQGRKWLAIENIWAEFEPLPALLRTQFAQNKNVGGIFEHEQKLWATSKYVQIPYFYLAKSERPTKEICTARSSKVNIWGERAGTDRQRKVHICESSSDGQRELYLVVKPDYQDGLETIFVHLHALRRCRAGEPCEIQLRAERGQISSSLDVESALDEAKRLVRSQAGLVPLKRSGMRTFFDQQLQLSFERLSGFSLSLRTERGTLEANGPVVLGKLDAVENLSPSLKISSIEWYDPQAVRTFVEGLLTNATY